MFIASPSLGCIFWASFGSLELLTTAAMKSHVECCLGFDTLQFCRVLNPYDIAVEKLANHVMCYVVGRYPSYGPPLSNWLA